MGYPYQPRPRPRDPDGELLLSRREQLEELADLAELAEQIVRLDAVRRLKDAVGGRTLRRHELDRAVGPRRPVQSRKRWRAG